MMSKIIMESLIVCFLPLLACVVGIANGAAGMVFFYDEKVQRFAVEKGLTTEERIKRNSMYFYIFGVLPFFAFVIAAVYGINGARGFFEGFWQITLLLLAEGIFDRFFIDSWWVNHTNAWYIEGTDSMKPYIPRDVRIKKWIGTVVGFPVIAAVISGIMALILK